MPVQMCPIDIPDGWEVVRYGVPKPGEYILDRDRRPLPVNHDFDSEWVIIRPARPALQVGDWVRVDCDRCGWNGRIGQLKAHHTNLQTWRVEIGNGSSCWLSGDLLRKQTRIIDPYTLDQCIAAAARLGREVVVQGGALDEIVALGVEGVCLRDFHERTDYMPYKQAARHLTWDNGDAFGIERWEDA